MSLYLEETYVNASEGHGIGESGVFESYFDTPGEAFKELQKEHGRCVSRVYVDGENGKPVAIGWVFQKRQQYDDAPETFLRETWAVLHAGPPETRHKYLTLGA